MASMRIFMRAQFLFGLRLVSAASTQKHLPEELRVSESILEGFGDVDADVDHIGPMMDRRRQEYLLEVKKRTDVARERAEEVIQREWQNKIGVEKLNANIVEVRRQNKQLLRLIAQTRKSIDNHRKHLKRIEFNITTAEAFSDVAKDRLKNAPELKVLQDMLSSKQALAEKAEHNRRLSEILRENSILDLESEGQQDISSEEDAAEAAERSRRLTEIMAQHAILDEATEGDIDGQKDTSLLEIDAKPDDQLAQTMQALAQLRQKMKGAQMLSVKSLKDVGARIQQVLKNQEKRVHQLETKRRGLEVAFKRASKKHDLLTDALTVLKEEEEGLAKAESTIKGYMQDVSEEAFKPRKD